MNKYDNELLKNCPSMIKGIAVEADELNGVSSSINFRTLC